MQGPVTETETFGDIKFSVTQLPAMRGYRLFAVVAKHATPALALIQSLADKGEDDILEHSEQLAAAARALFAELSPDVAQDILVELFSSATVVRDSTQIELNSETNINRAFQGRGFDMMRAQVFALKVNFADFYDAVRSAIAASKPAPKEEAATPKDSKSS